jgi:hypothetical protein
MIIQVCLQFFQQSSKAIVEQVTVRAIGVEQGHLLKTVNLPASVLNP